MKVHAYDLGWPRCGVKEGAVTENPKKVTCKRCLAMLRSPASQLLAEVGITKGASRALRHGRR